MKKLFAILLFIFVALAVQAQQTMVVKGQILDEDEETGLSFALVKVDNNIMYADSEGFFEITLSAKESILIEANQLGYETKVARVADNFENVLLALRAKTLFLEEVLVSDDPYHSQPQSDIIVDKVQSVSQPRDVADLFSATPGFSLVKKGGYAMDPVFRSFKYEQLNVIYDGGIQTTYACPGRMDPTTTHINPQDVKKIELIRGPFSVRYGPTMGAIVNVVTETFDYEADPGFGGSLESGFETNGSSKMTKLSLNGSNQKFDFALLGGLKDYGSYQSGNGTVVPSSFKTYDYNLKLGYNPGKNQRLYVNWRQAFNRDVLHAGLAMDTDSDNSDFLSLDYSWKNINPKLVGLNIKAYGTQVNHIMTNHRRPNFMMVDAVAEVSATTVGGKAELSVMPGKKTMLYVGTDYRYVGRDGERLRIMKRNMMTGEELPMPMKMTDAIWQNSTINDLGLFLEGRYFANARWSFLVGSRLDFVNSAIKDPAEDFTARYSNLNIENEWNLSATASATYTIPSGWNFQLALGRGVRTANMIERYINHFTVGMDAYEYVGNPFLTPEVNNQVEFSVNKKTEAFQAGANLFYSYLNDYITGMVDTTIARKYMGSLPYARRFVNVGEAIQYGFELTGQIQLAKYLSTSGSLAFTRAQNLDWDEPLPEISPMEATLAISYERPVWWINAQGRFVDNQNQVSITFDEGTTPGFSEFDLRLGVKPIKGLSFGMAVLNIFDRQYREHLNRSYRNATQPGVIYEPGRNWTFFAKYSF